MNTHMNFESLVAVMRRELNRMPKLEGVSHPAIVFEFKPHRSGDMINCGFKWHDEAIGDERKALCGCRIESIPSQTEVGSVIHTLMDQVRKDLLKIKGLK